MLPLLSISAMKRAMALHAVVPRFVAILFREIILVVFPALTEIQISAGRIQSLDVMEITTTSECL